MPDDDAVHPESARDAALLETFAVLRDPAAMAAVEAYRADPDDVAPWAVVVAELRAANRLQR